MGKSTINTCLCDLFSVGVSNSPRLVNLLINYPCPLAVLSRRFPTTLIEIAVSSRHRIKRIAVTKKWHVKWKRISEIVILARLTGFDENSLSHLSIFENLLSPPTMQTSQAIRFELGRIVNEARLRRQR